MATLTDGLANYFQQRQDQRTQRVAAKWAALNKRQQRLVREAAVMGYLQGYKDAEVNHKFRGDAAIVDLVLDATDAFSDLYPVLAALPKIKRLS